MDSAFVIPGGWEIVAMKYVQKDFTAITAWSRASAHWVILHVMQLEDACVASDFMEKNATNLVPKLRCNQRKRHPMQALLGVS